MASYNRVLGALGETIPSMIIRDDGVFVLTDPGAADVDAVAFRAWLSAGNTLGPAIRPPAQVAEGARQQSFRDDVQRAAMLNRLKTATSAQIDTYVQNNVTNLAQAQVAIGIILKLIANDGRS